MHNEGKYPFGANHTEQQLPTKTELEKTITETLFRGDPRGSLFAERMLHHLQEKENENDASPHPDVPSIR